MQAGSLQMHLKEKKMKMASLRGNHFKKEAVDPDSDECDGRESLILSLKTGMSNRLPKGSQYRNDQWLKVLWRRSRGDSPKHFLYAREKVE